MKNFAFYILLPELNYVAPVIGCFPPDSVDIHIGPRLEPIKDFKSVPDSILNKIRYFQDAGYNVLPLDPEKVPHYEGVVLSSMFQDKNNAIFKWNLNKLPPILSYSHSIDRPMQSDNSVSSWYIGTSRRQVEMPEYLKFAKSRNPEEFRMISGLPRKTYNEYAYSGPYHIGEWAERRKLPRNVLQSGLEEKLGAKFPAGKPVAAFLVDEYCHPRQVNAALQQLAPHVSLVIKLSGAVKKSGIWQKIKDAYEWPDDDYAPNLLRFAADFILAGYNSGTLASSLMLGLRVIPYYTSMVYRKIHVDRNSLPKRINTGYNYYMPARDVPRSVCHDILEIAASPIDLMNTEALLQRMSDSSWWEGYRARLPQAQKTIFGEYIIEGAPQKAASQILRAFGRKSFGNDAAAVRLKPEYASLLKIRPEKI